MRHGARCCGVLGLDARFEFHEEESQLVLPRLVADGRCFDLAFVDGDHRFHSASIDIYYALRLGGPGRLVVVEDVEMPAVRRAVAHYQTKAGCEVLAADGSGWRTLDEAAFQRSSARVAALRRPEQPPEGSWDDFVPFGAVRPRSRAAGSSRDRGVGVASLLRPSPVMLS